MPKISAKSIFGHLKTVLRHKFEVFKLCWRSGLYWQGIAHDMSKFSPTEFGESARYYTGTHSPITESKKVNGYSVAWLHHRGHNPHHFEYWVDNLYKGGEAAPMPYKYAAELVCDMVAAAKVYNGAAFTKDCPWNYWIDSSKPQVIVHPQTETFVDAALTEYRAFGDAVFSQENLKQIYRQASGADQN